MEQYSFEGTILGRSARIVGNFGYVTLSRDVGVTFDRITLDWIVYLFPTGLLRLHRDGKGRQYVDLRGCEGSQERYPLARIILALRRVTDPQNRQAHYRDCNRYNLLPENLYLGEAGYLSGSDAAWQEVERRKWARSVDSNPDVTPAKIIGGTPQPPQTREGEPATFPHVPASEASPGGVDEGGAGGGHD